MILQVQEDVEAAAEECAKQSGHFELPARQTHSRLEWLLPLLFCGLMLAQLNLSSQGLSLTADEATHLYSGYRYLKCFDFTVSPEHPPLAKVVDALPLLAMNVAVDCAPFKGDALSQSFTSVNWLFAQNWKMMLSRARAVASIFTIGLCALVWIGARRMFGLGTAIVACTLLVFEPNILAYGSLILTDLPVTCMLLLVTLAFYLWVRHRTVSFLLFAGVTTGLTLLTKHSGVAVMPILVTLAIGHAIAESDIQGSKWRVAAQNLIAVILICALAAGVVWLGYGMHFGANPGAQDEMTAASQAAVTGYILLMLEKHQLLPQPYLRGFSQALTLSNQSSVTFVAGKIYLHAPWFSTPFNFVIRNTPATLVLILFGVVGLAMTLKVRQRERLFVLLPLVVFLAVCLRASSNVSMRYLLPMVPFLLIAIADGCVELARRARWAGCALLGLLLLHAASSLRAFPNYLSYADDMWGGPSQAYKYIPWIDMGQAYTEARVYLQRHPTPDCWFVTGWNWDPANYSLPCQVSGLYRFHQIPPHLQGTVIVSSSLLTDVRLPEQQLAAAFKGTEPKDHIGGSALLVYEGNFDTRLNAATAEGNLAASALGEGRAAEALEHGDKAVSMAPLSPLAHGNLCGLLANVRADEALIECVLARNLLLHDPLLPEQARQKHLKVLEAKISLLTNTSGAHERVWKSAPHVLGPTSSYPVK
jgi:4-amino-4-deoxy-L-arabinose transferase-like glycosyltransferase